MAPDRFDSAYIPFERARGVFFLVWQVNDLASRAGALRSFALILRAIFNAQRLGLLRTLLLALGQVQGDQFLVKGVGRPKSKENKPKAKSDAVKKMESKYGKQNRDRCVLTPVLCFCRHLFDSFVS
jgi:hypothetical protein